METARWGPGYGHPLLLSPGQLEAPLPHHGVVAVGKRQDGLVDLGQLGGLRDLHF